MVHAWHKIRDEAGTHVVERKGEESEWRMFTNCKSIAERSRKTWLNSNDLSDPRCFQKDVCVGLLESERAREEVFVSHCVYSIETIRGADDENERKIMVMLRRCHENLGHPSVARMTMLLKAAHASEKVLKLAKGLTCETCQELSKPKSHNVSKVRRAVEFNQQLCVDTFEMDVRDSKLHFLNIVDEGTGFQMVIPLWKGMQAKKVRNCYRKGWKRWAGPPVRLFCDGGKEFEGEFEHGCSLDGTFLDASAAYSPWQNGLVEKRGDIWKAAFAKAQLETRPRTKAEVQELVHCVTNAVNSMTRKDGYAPNQHVFGKDVRLPGMLSSDPDPAINSALVQGESLFERRMEMRSSARRAFLEADGEMRLRRAMEHRTRPERGPFSEGDLAFFWRKNRFDQKHHWHGPGVVIGKSGGSKVWIARGTKVYRCSPEQLRKLGLSPEQESMVRLLPVDMVRVRDEVSARGAGNYIDLSMLSTPPDVEETPDQDSPDQGLPPSGEDDAEAGANGVRASAENQVGAAMELEPEPPQNAVVQGNSGDESPNKRARTSTWPVPTSLVRAMRANPELLDTGVVRASEPSSGSQGVQAHQVPVPVTVESEDDLEVHQVEADHWVVDHGRRKLIRMHVIERSHDYVPSQHELPVSVESLEDCCVSVKYFRLGSRKTNEYAWKNPHVQPKSEGLWTGKTEFTLKHGWSWKEKGQQTECFEATAKKGRKEVNEKELPDERKHGLRAAKVKEWKKHVSSGAIVVHTGKDAERLRAKIPRSRFLKSRFVVTESDPGASPETCDLKARWCIRGYLDPDLLALDTSSPTLSAEGLALALQLMASCKWRLKIADVEGAFLRGDKLEPSGGKIYIEMPPGGVDGLEAGCVVEAVKTVYGLADAPKAWWVCFSKRLVSLGLKVSRFDPCVFLFHDENKLAGIVALHVDDLCVGGNKAFEEKVLAPLREMFPFKHWKEGEGQFLGKYLKQEADGGILVTQKEYAQEMKGIRVLGGLQWLVTGSRPDLAAWSSLLQQRVNCAVVNDLIELNKLVSMAHDGREAHIWIKSIPVDQVQFCVLTDAAWANGKDCCSQAGYMVAACDHRLPAGEWGEFSVMRWKSYKQDRQTHSTLGAELLSLSRGLAEARWIRSMWCEATCAEYELQNDFEWSTRIPITAVIDCKPVYDHAQSATVAIKDKRMAIEMLLLKEDIGRFNVQLKWMATKQMIVDVLTKKGAPMNLFRKVVRDGWFILVEDEAVVQVSSKKIPASGHVIPGV
ncbi:RE1 [Symbiodinium sp. CCMP2592]|nr:RE1 [Symbiodinium sp. CCMP2592]